MTPPTSGYVAWKAVIISLLQGLFTRPPSGRNRSHPSSPSSGTTSPPSPRVKFFAWLLVQNRIQCKSNLLKKNILDDDTCELCNNGSEDADHIISRCPFARSLWEKVGWGSGRIAKVSELWTSSPPHGTHQGAAPSLILLFCWELWKHRHDVVFRHLAPSVDHLVAACRASVQLGQCRVPRRSTELNSFDVINFPPP